MRSYRLLFIFLISIFAICQASAQNYNWITPNKVYLKTYISGNGMFRISKNDFINAGVNTSSIDPRTVKVLNAGTQLPIYFSGESDGVFNDGDYFDFYGKRLNGGPTITYTENNVPIYTTNEYYNLYSDTNAYWIDWGGANGLRYQQFNYSVTNNYPSSFFYDTLHFEKDMVYTLGEHLSGADYRFLNNEKFRGEGWYWALLANQQSVSDTFSLPNKNPLSQNATIRVFAYPSNKSSIPNEHSLIITINGVNADTIYSNDMNRIDTTITFPSSLLSNFSVNTVSVKYASASGFGEGLMYFDLFEIAYERTFKLGDYKLSADLSRNADTTSKLFKIPGYNSTKPTYVYDVKNNLRISNLTSNADTIRFTAKSNADIQIVNDTIRSKPFRIKQRQVPDLVSGSNSAVYLIIYNQLFQQQAEQLRAYRQAHDGFLSVKANIEDIYDIFGYGNESPQAVRNFTTHVYNNWQLPKLKYICLFGRGSLDPKKNSPATVYSDNLVPVIGNPDADGYFGNFIQGTFFYYTQVAVGRLPALYVSEAQAMVDKIIAYENEPEDNWWKTFTYITGGSTPNEQLQYQSVSNFESNFYAALPPIAGEIHKIYRSDTSGNVTFNYADSIKNNINRGTLFVNFRGHAGSHDWEVGMHDPNVLSNGNKLPVILSLTCFTGEDAQSSFRGFGEKFVYLENKGAIGFIGTTGWSYASPGNNLGTYFIQSMKSDTMRRTGDLLRIAEKTFLDDSGTFSIRHTVNCYSLLGDPAAILKLPKTPELSITNRDYKFPNEPILVNEPTSLTIFPKNYGLYADSCKIRFQLKRNNQDYSFRDTVYRAFRFLDTLVYQYKIDSPGVYSMFIKLDQDNWYPSEDEANNSILISIPLSQNLCLPISPVDNSIQLRDSVEFSALNPRVSFGSNTVKAIFQIDTSQSFNSPASRTFVKSNLSGTVTKFKTNLPYTQNNLIYYWRLNAVINNDSTGWSKIQRLVFSDGSVRGTVDQKDRYINSLLPALLSKSSEGQYSPLDFSNTGFAPDGITLNTYVTNLFVRSYGSNGEEASFFSVGNRNIYIDGGRNTGLNFLKVGKKTGSILAFRNFRMNSQQSNDTLLTFLNSYDTTQYLMLLNAAYTAGGVELSPAVKNRLRQFGSIYCDSISLLGYFHTWSFIGWLNANSSQVCESFDPCCRNSPGCTACDHWTESVCSMNVTFSKVSGSVSNIIGPAQSWNDLSWSHTGFNNSSIAFDIIGIGPDGQQTLLQSNVQTNNFTDLTQINTSLYPRLNLLARFSLDSLIGTQSSILRSLRVNYMPSSELVLDNNSFQLNTETGKKNFINYSFDYHNAGFTYLYGIIVNVYDKSVNDSNLLSADTVRTLLKIDSTLNYNHSLNAPQFFDSTRIIIQIKPLEKYSEFYTFNNSVEFGLTSVAERKSDVVEVYSDGKLIGNGDHVSREPEIKIKMKSSSDFRFRDTSQIMLKLNNSLVPFYHKGTPSKNQRNGDNKSAFSQEDFDMLYHPVLSDGKNSLTVIYETNENEYDTLTYDVFTGGDLMFKDFYNYPNPMKDETSFIFSLTGNSAPELLKIKIYTITGRLIKEIEIHPIQGYNSIMWDGKDNDGEHIANGTYLYKLTSPGDGSIKSEVQKLVILK